MNKDIRDRALQSSKFFDRLMIDSEEFGDVAYEIRGRAMRVVIFTETGMTQFAGTFGELKRFFLEGLAVINEWEAL